MSYKEPETQLSHEKTKYNMINSINSQQDKLIPTKRGIIYLFLLFGGLLAMILVTIFVQKPSNPVEFARNIGYGGIFIMGIIGSASPVWPLPGSWAAGLGAAFGLNPIFVALSAGIGEAIGEISGYTAGYGGQIFTQKWKRYIQIKNWMSHRGGLTIFFVSAIPNFFVKLATVAAGTLRYPIWKFFIFCWAGKTIKSFCFAFVGWQFSEWLTKFFESNF